MPNTSGNPTSANRWQWTPSRATPLPPKHGGTAPSGDIRELIDYLCQIRGQGATITEAEQVWVEGMQLIDLRAAQFLGKGPVVNDFYGVVDGEWRVYVGRPSAAMQNTYALAFSTRTGRIARGLYPRDIGPHPIKAGQEALFNFRIIYP